MKKIRGISREEKRRKARNGMRITNRSIFTIQETMVKRSEDIKKKKRGK